MLRSVVSCLCGGIDAHISWISPVGRRGQVGLGLQNAVALMPMNSRRTPR